MVKMVNFMLCNFTTIENKARTYDSPQPSAPASLASLLAHLHLSAMLRPPLGAPSPLPSALPNAQARPCRLVELLPTENQGKAVQWGLVPGPERDGSSCSLESSSPRRQQVQRGQPEVVRTENGRGPSLGALSRARGQGVLETMHFLCFLNFVPVCPSCWQCQGQQS